MDVLLMPLGLQAIPVPDMSASLNANYKPASAPAARPSSPRRQEPEALLLRRGQSTVQSQPVQTHNFTRHERFTEGEGRHRCVGSREVESGAGVFVSGLTHSSAMARDADLLLTSSQQSWLESSRALAHPPAQVALLPSTQQLVAA